MEKENLAIRISGVKKEYRLGSIGGRTLQADLQSWFARKRGREDPNVKIGQDERLVGQKFMALNGIDILRSVSGVKCVGSLEVTVQENRPC